MSVDLHRGDLPDGVDFGNIIAIDTETMGLSPHRDRLCLVQLSAGDGTCHIVQLPREKITAPNLKRLLEDRAVTKLFHFARFDLAMLKHHLGADCRPVYCTKIASRLARTYTDRHGLKDLCKELLGIEISKQQQSSDWGGDTLSDDQLQYAAGDVLHLHRIKDILDDMLRREGRAALAQAAFEFLPARAELDLLGYEGVDVFAHA